MDKPHSPSIRIQRERLCENLFKLRSSEEYKLMWKRFLRDSIDMMACPIFYQAITDQLVKTLVKVKYPVTIILSTTVTPNLALDSIEKNVIRYMAGYVIHSLKKKINNSTHFLKEEILFCLTELEVDGGKL